MSNAVIALVLIGSSLAYLFGAGSMYAVSKHRNWDYNMPGPYLAIVLWPAILPAILAATLTARLLRSPLPTAKVVR